ncbi:hypothetical protein [Pseudomonas nitroreducens]|nr:hypothetical protein [Pseudomonas nitroreducens]
MLPSPRIIAIDDEDVELNALVNSLNSSGYACLAVKYDAEGVACNAGDARVIFFDLHLNGNSNAPRETHFSVIESVLSAMRPAGPYVVILWTKYSGADEESPAGPALLEYLNTRLEGVSRPYNVLALDKVEYLRSGRVADVGALIGRVNELLCVDAQIRALLSWEKDVLSSASSTVNQLVNLSKDANIPLASTLANLASAAVGTINTETDPYQAINDALIPILSDRLGGLPAEVETKDLHDVIWKSAYSVADLAGGLAGSQKVAINKFINLSSRVSGYSLADRGAVADLNSIWSRKDFVDYFGLDYAEVVKRYYSVIRGDADFSSISWVVCQVRAACDYANDRPVPMPFFIGIEVDERYLKSGGSRPEHIWVSPVLDINKAGKVLVFNAGSVVVLTAARAKKCQIKYRIKDQMLNDMLFKLRLHQARPGMISL